MSNVLVAQPHGGAIFNGSNLPVVPAGTTPFDSGHAAAELLRRRRARTSLIDFSRAIEIPGAPVPDTDPEEEAFLPAESQAAAHHRLMMAAIQRCMESYRTTGVAGRLMIFAPPGSAKSTYGSVVAPAWGMGRWPGERYIIASYGSDIATKQSRKARALCRQKRYTSIWPERPVLPNDQRAVDQWALTNRSEMMAAGFEAGITGNRANGIFIDDPVRNREAADSPVQRDKTYNEYIDSVLTRLMPGGFVIIVQTRWHEDDLSGGILPEDYAGESGMILCRDGQTWEVLNLPAKCERVDDPLGRPVGAYLWPEWFPESHWWQWERNPRAQRAWSALYQQRPSPVAGLQFQRAMFRWYDSSLPVGQNPPGTTGYGNILSGEHPCGPPVAVRSYGASDYATKDEGGDFTEHGQAGMDPLGNMIFDQWWEGQRETDKSIAAWQAIVIRARQGFRSWATRCVRWWNEGGPIDKAIKPAINRAMRESTNGTGFVTCEPMTSIKDKATKCLSFHARASAHTIYFDIRNPLHQKVVDQLVQFPTGKYDDKVDVCGLLGRGIDQMGEGAIPSGDIEMPKGPKPFTAAWLEYDDGSDKPRVRYRS